MSRVRRKGKERGGMDWKFTFCPSVWLTLEGRKEDKSDGVFRRRITLYVIFSFATLSSRQLSPTFCWNLFGVRRRTAPLFPFTCKQRREMPFLFPFPSQFQSHTWLVQLPSPSFYQYRILSINYFSIPQREIIQEATCICLLDGFLFVEYISVCKIHLHFSNSSSFRGRHGN